MEYWAYVFILFLFFILAEFFFTPTDTNTLLSYNIV